MKKPFCSCFRPHTKVFVLLALAAFACLTTQLAAQIDEDRRPEPIKQPQPIYPSAMKDSGMVGEVTIEFVVDTQGNVQSPTIISSNNPSFEQPAIDAISKWKFKPGIKNGAPVNTKIRIPIESRLVKSTQPEVIKQPQPVYPRAMQESGMVGQVMLELVVNAQGNVQDPSVVSSNNPNFEQPAIDAVLKWKFKPGTRDGKPVGVRMRIPMEFVLDK